MVNITVVGMGKIGLPLAVQFASKGHNVVGSDINKLTVDKINSKIEPFPGEEFLQEKLEKVVDAGKFIATTNTTEAVSKSDVVVVVVPLFVDDSGKPDFGWMDSATISIGKGLRAGTLVSFETTLPVGTTRNRFAKILEDQSGMNAGSDFYLAFSPERVLSGRIFQDLRRYPKLVGGINEISGKKAKEFYEQVLDFDERIDLSRPNGVWDLGNSETSELAKLSETTYRDVNIALANEFAQYAIKTGINFANVIEACNSQPFSHIHQPGIAVGGHCIPVYPHLYMYGNTDAKIVDIARSTNTNMPKFAIDLIESVIGKLSGLKVAILGAAYRGGVKELAFSGVYPLLQLLSERNAQTYVHDPLFTNQELTDLKFTPYNLGEHADVVIVQSDHSEYQNLSSIDFRALKLVLDGRSVLNADNFKDVHYLDLQGRSRFSGSF